MARAAEVTVAIRPYIRSSGEACERSCMTSESRTQMPSGPRIAAGACSRPATRTAASAARPPAKARAMPWRAGHMPFSRNQPAAVTAWSSTSGTSRAQDPAGAVTASSRRAAR